MKKIIVFLIKFYQITLSPLLGPNCRFQPTCSQFMIEAIKHHGVLKGLSLGFKRISKCHPFGANGYDPVPGKEE
ncbi:MAG: membrane protein insertion efficiency factor YidD [SAR86 cluster bacterium]|uniref:Putative membrane protein insertion efficiency factor n=1 Tax=SAR86 cluster bacterium TaxID=2030880 RepID=A0A937I6U6_9GAMM|nr:membrane protein insertion efficiency factor YidD [SAR86 cluster bacterium]